MKKNRKNLLLVVGVLLIAVVGFVGYRYYEVHKTAYMTQDEFINQK